VAAAIRVRAFHADALDVRVAVDTGAMAHAAVEEATQAIAAAVKARGEANVMFASGNSQLAFLAELTTVPDLAWDRVRAFHMDEYVGIPADHPASFRRYMHERIASRVSLRGFEYLEGDRPDPEREADRYAQLLHEHPLDLCCAGIGENGHLAFNDPPVADFSDAKAVKVVALDDASRRQQVGEGHFAALGDVPTNAITVTIPALLAARRVFVIVPEARKAPAVAAALTGPITTRCPASFLRNQAHATLFLDPASAAQIP
jgi:glucosamine-6-phosphate deaminase